MVASAKAFPRAVASTNLAKPASALAIALSPISASIPRRIWTSPVNVAEVVASAFAQLFLAEAPAPSSGCEMRAKLVAGWTGANERTVKNWILGRYAPCGRHLVTLAQHSDQVLHAILSMADRQDLLLAPKVEDLRQKVFELAAIMGRPDPEA